MQYGEIAMQNSHCYENGQVALQAQRYIAILYTEGIHVVFYSPETKLEPSKPTVAAKCEN